MELKPEEITKLIRNQIKHYESRIQLSETGVVILAGDGIARVSGLTNCMAGELVEFPDGSPGLCQNLEEEAVSVIILGSDAAVKEGDVVKRNEKIGVIGIGVDHNGTMSAYIQFMIINTKSNTPMNVMDCFKK